MPFLQLKLVSKIEIGQNSTCSFSHQGGSIGRSNDCDWTLLDVDRYISNKHALISYQNEQFIITDMSSNGVFINNANIPLGKQNTHILNQADRIKIGSYEIEVENLQIVDTPVQVGNQSSQVGDGDLLGLVMGDDSSTHNDQETDYLNISTNDNYDHHSSVDDGLGLNDILSGSSNYKTPPVNTHSASTFDNSAQNKPVFTESDKHPVNHPAQSHQPQSNQSQSNQHYVSNDSSIPEDWELSGILPAIQDYEPLKPNTPRAQEPTLEPQTEQPDFMEPVAPIEQVKAAPIEQAKAIEPVAPIEQARPVEQSTAIDTPVSHAPELVMEPKADIPLQEEVIMSKVPTPAQSSNEHDKSIDAKVEQPMQSGSNEFLLNLYNKLGLPKEYLASIDEDVFAEDIATVMLSTTKGLMSLLNSRTVFKQESRLSLTSVQPRSNNPIKFSIDPADTLEMLLLKKKKGYLTAKESYDEAVSDIQLHQMAFLSGLQATVTGVLNQISPESIEKQINEKGRSFMGLKASSQYWQLYKEKQELLAKSVTENLNEVLSTYFSEAYQAQINHFKNDKK